MNALEIHDLQKAFRGRPVIAGLSLTVPEHSIYGFLGVNGAGKTTTMKMVLGLLKADSGRILAMEEPVRYGETTTNRFIGYLPDVPEFYSYMSGSEYLRLCGEITHMPPEEIKSRSRELLEMVGLPAGRKRIGGYSRGMKQRLGIAQALLHRPKLLICDEPTSALDPVGRKEILDILSQVRSQTTIIFSTHILSDVERICDHVGILHGGKLAFEGSMEDVRRRRGEKGVRLQLRQGGETLIQYLKTHNPDQLTLEEGDGFLLVKGNSVEQAGAAVLAGLQETGLLPERWELWEPTLESLFMEVAS